MAGVSFETPLGVLVGNNTNNSLLTANTLLIGGNQMLPAIIDLGIIIGDGTNIIPLGATGRTIGPFDFAGQLLQWSIIGQETGNVSIDIWKCTYAQYDGGSTHPIAADIISNTNPIIMNGIKNQGNNNLWISNFSVGDMYAFNVSSVANSKQVSIFIKTLKLS